MEDERTEVTEEKEQEENTSPHDRVEEALLVVRFPLLRGRLGGSCEMGFVRETQ